MYNKLKYFPLGKIRPTGFLKQQFLLCKDGIGGHLDELEPDMIANPYVNKTYVDAWLKSNQNGWGAEISGTYYCGLIGLAFTLGDEELIQKATTWVNAVLKNQKSDGYLGTYTEEDADIYADFNAWGTGCALRALLHFYSATKRDDVLQGVYKCLLWFCDKWKGDKKTTYAGVFLVESMVICYDYIKDDTLIDFCNDYMDFLCRHDEFLNSIDSLSNDTYEYNSYHSAAYGMCVKQPAILYSATGTEKYLNASIKGIEKVRKKSLNLSGGVVSNTEYLGPISPNSETEYCTYTFFNSAYSYLSYITSESKYGDYIEELFYNGAMGARKKDERAIAYMSAPNQIFATDTSSPIFEDKQVYAPCYPTSCCPTNAVVILSEFVRSMALTDENDNVFLPVYGPCSINDGEIIEKTMYPFRNSVILEINTERTFELNLKIPCWCEEFDVKINNIPQTYEKNSLGYITLKKVWACGDIVEINFKTTPKTVQIDDVHGKHPLAFKYGALLFSLPIEENWIEIPGNPMTPLPKEWSWYSVIPKDNNKCYCVAVDENTKNIEMHNLDTDDYVWTNSPLVMNIDGYKAPYVYAPYISKTTEPYEQYVCVKEPVKLQLVPYGCTNLRISYFPKARK